MVRKSNGGLALAIAAGTAGLVSFTASSARADLLLYEPFNYTAGQNLGGSGASAGSPIGQTGNYTAAAGGGAYNWYARGTQSNYQSANDTLISSGNLSYTGLAASQGNFVSYGTAAGYADTVALPSSVTSGNLYASFIIRIKSNLDAGARHSPASFVTDTSNAGNAGGALTGASGSTFAQPGGLWMRADPVLGGTSGGVTNFSPSKSNSDGIGAGATGPSAGWQHSALGTNVESNQFGDLNGQVGPTAGDSNTYQTYFVVMKYAFDTMTPAVNGQNDSVSLWMNPGSGTLGQANGETLASQAATGNLGSYFAAVNAFGTGALDVTSINSFALIGHRQNLTTTIAVDVDELRIGTTWADVTPAAPTAQTYYWDINGTTAGAGGAGAPSGVWDGVENNFNTNSAGGSGTFAWDPTAADTVVFSAGSGATGNFTVSVSGTRTASAIVVEEGNVVLGGGTLAVPSFDVAADTSIVAISTLNGGTANSITKTGAGTLVLAGANTYTGGTTVNAGALVVGNADGLNGGSLSIANAASAKLATDLPKAVTVSTLTTAGTGHLDVTNNSMVIKGMTAGQVRTQLQSGYNGGAWNGSAGIVSSSVDSATSVGYATNAQLGNLTEFKGVTGLTGTDVLVKYTYAGDANLDGKVDIGDLGLLAGAWQQLTGKVWFDGDFTYDGAVDIGDLGLLAGNWQKGTAGNPNPPLMTFSEALAQFSAFDGVVVPEPASAAALFAGAVGLGLTRRRRRA